MRRKRSDHVPGQNPAEKDAPGLLDSILHDPGRAAAIVESDLRHGADPSIILGVLDAAEAVLAFRGVDRSSYIVALRRKVQRTPR